MDTRDKITPKLHIFPMVPHNKCWQWGCNKVLSDFPNTGSQPTSFSHGCPKFKPFQVFQQSYHWMLTFIGKIL